MLKPNVLFLTRTFIRDASVISVRGLATTKRQVLVSVVHSKVGPAGRVEPAHFMFVVICYDLRFTVIHTPAKLPPRLNFAKRLSNRFNQNQSELRESAQYYPTVLQIQDAIFVKSCLELLFRFPG